MNEYKPGTEIDIEETLDDTDALLITVDPTQYHDGYYAKLHIQRRPDGTWDVTQEEVAAICGGRFDDWFVRAENQPVKVEGTGLEALAGALAREYYADMGALLQALREEEALEKVQSERPSGRPARQSHVEDARIISATADTAIAEFTYCLPSGEVHGRYRTTFQLMLDNKVKMTVEQSNADGVYEVAYSTASELEWSSELEPVDVFSDGLLREFLGSEFNWPARALAKELVAALPA